MAVRQLSPNKVQEFARILFVDDISNYKWKAEDQAPFEQQQSYQTTTSQTTTDGNLRVRKTH